MKNFKLLSGYNEEEIEEHNGASWIYAREENIDPHIYHIVVEHHNGIHSFLNQFPNHFIVPIISIIGPNLIVHNADNDGIGWGFDITRDEIRIEWASYRT